MNTIEVQVNGHSVHLEVARASLSEAAQQVNALEPYATLVNQEFIPASERASVTLSQGDVVEILGAIQGG